MSNKQCIITVADLRRRPHSATYKVKKADLALVPAHRWIRLGATVLEGLVALVEESLVPLAVNVPMLHRL